MKYFSVYTVNSLPKNRLCDDFFEWLKGYNHSLWLNGIEDFEELFKAKIDELNAQNPKCNPLQFYKWEMETSETIMLSATIREKCCTIAFYKVIKEF